MAETIAKAMKRPGAAPALVAGLGVFVALLVIGFVQALFSTLSVIVYASAAQDYVGQVWFGQLVNSLTGPLPFAVGVFLCFWQVAPVAPTLRLAHVVTRSILAALLGGGVMWIVLWVTQVIVDLSSFAPEFQNGVAFGKVGPDALESLFHALAVTAGYLPIAVLAGILLWGWLQRHPLAKPVHGALDEV